MDHSQASQQLTQYLDGSLGEAECLGLEEHLASCGECADWVNAYRLLAELAGKAAPSASSHLSSDQLSRFAIAPQTLDTPVRETCESHLQDCSACREEVALALAAADEAANREVPSIAPPAAAASYRPLAWAAGLLLVVGVVFMGRSVSETPASRQLSDLTVSGPTAVSSRDSILVETTLVETGAELNLRAGNTVAFGDGFSVDSGGTLSVEVNGSHDS